MTAIPYSNRISIRDFLARRGIQPKYERNGYGMYLSPLREERTPSFKVDYVRNLWYDFGLGEGGTLLTLVMRLERCDRYAAIRILSSGEIRQAESTSLSSGIYERPAVGGVSPVLRPAAVPALRILSDAPLRHPALVGYLASRGIVLSVAAAFCREVRYEVNGRAFFAVGFRNDAGGWELRSERFKGGSSPKHITTLDNGSDTAMAFEGFIDFLSYLSLKGNPSPSIDSIVLNSVTNLHKGCSVLLAPQGRPCLPRQRRRRAESVGPTGRILTLVRSDRPVRFLPRPQRPERIPAREAAATSAAQTATARA